MEDRESLALTYEEFQYIKGFSDYWRRKGGGDYMKFPTTRETKEFYTKWTLEFLKKKYPDAKFYDLEYKESVLKVMEAKGEQPSYDTVAFKFKPNRPELYLIVQDIPAFLDEYRFDAYEKGPFVRPNWDNVNN